MSRMKILALRWAVVAGLPAFVVACGSDGDAPGLDASASGNTDAARAEAGPGVDAAPLDTTPQLDSALVLDGATPDVASQDTAASLPANALTAKQVVAGERWSLAVRPNGDLYAWGQYVDPETGHYQNGGTYAARPVKVQGLSDVRAAGGYGTGFFAVKNDGSVWGWGFLNAYESFAQGKDAAGGGRVTEPAPVQLLQGAGEPLTQICEIVPTVYGVVMLRSEATDGACTPDQKRSVWYTGTSLTGYEPGLVAGLYAKKFTPLAPGVSENLIGQSWVTALYGNNYYVNAISLYAKLNDGRVFAWGNNQSGQLGLDDQLPRDRPTAAPAWNGVKTIVTSTEVTFGLLPNGTVLTAGSPYGKTLGLAGVTANQKTPTVLDGLTGVTALGVATSSSIAFAIVDGGLRYWGSPTLFGEPSATPRPFPAPETALVALSVGNQHVLAIDARGAVYAWGSNQLKGLGCGACEDSPVPLLVTAP